MSKHSKGAKQGTVRIWKHGRAMLKCLEHPVFGTRWMLRSNFVWWRHYGSVVPSGYCIHHKDRNKTNDKIRNLQLVTNSEHAKIHNAAGQLGPASWTEESYRKSKKSKEGFRFTAESRLKMRKSHIGLKPSIETCAKFSRRMLGNTYRLGHVGWKHTAQTRLKIKVKLTGNTNNLGHAASEETRGLQSRARKEWWARKRASENTLDLRRNTQTHSLQEERIDEFFVNGQRTHQPLSEIAFGGR